MWPDRVSNPGPLTYESGALPIALRGPASGSIEEAVKIGLGSSLKWGKLTGGCPAATNIVYLH